MSKSIKRIFILLSFCLLLVSTSLLYAQDGAIEFPGEIIAIDGNIITVGGIAVDISDAIMPADGLNVGMQVQVIGARQDQTIIATIIVITDFGTAPTSVPPEPTATVTPDMTTTMTPTLDVTTTPTLTPTITPTVDLASGVPIIVIEGPVQAINVTTITIFDIDIEVDPASSVLTQIRIGDTVRVEGESSFSGDTIIIVAVDITIIETTLIVVNNNYIVGDTVFIPSLPPSCKRTKNGKITCKKKSKKSKKSS